MTANARILVLDDDSLLRSILAERLERSGYDVVQATSLAEARRAVLDVPPDVAVLDIMLPDGKGIDLIEPFEQAYGIPVIMMTSNATVPRSGFRLSRSATLSFVISKARAAT